jgi:hypothetical protein
METAQLIGDKRQEFVLHWCPEIQAQLDLEHGAASQTPEEHEVLLGRTRSRSAAQVALGVDDYEACCVCGDELATLIFFRV